jgi:glycosyltransferase involved in cell wall biosynthesis
MSTAMPPVSILITAWGCRDYILSTIESALAQDHPDFEVVVVEDHGSDGTWEAASRVHDPRLVLHRNEVNLGQYGNKNRALAHARHRLVNFLDGDDLLEPFALRRLVEAWMKAGEDAAIVFGNFVAVDAGGALLSTPRKWGVSGAVAGDAVLERVTRMREPASPFGNVTPHLFDRDALLAIGGFPNDNAGSGDLETFLKLLAGRRVVFLEETVARYRVRPGSMGSRTFGLRESVDFLRMVTRLEEYFSTRDVPGHLKDQGFMRDWKVWAAGHNILACYQRKIRGLPSQFDEIRAAYVQAGLGREFDRFVRRQFAPFVARHLMTRARSFLGMPALRPLFPSGFEGRV